MRRTSRYIWRIISVCALLLSALSAYSEGSSGKSKKPSVKPQAVLYGCYVDVDVMDPILHLFDKTRNGYDASLEVDLFHRIYPSFVIGYQSYDASDTYNYPIPAENPCHKVDGLYFKVGLSANVWKKNYYKKLNPISYIGLNYACSPHFNSEISGYPIDNGFWGGEGQAESTLSYQGKNKARWGEVFLGMKAPVVGHFCLGVEVMLKLLLHTETKGETAYHIHHSYAPGFGSEKNGKWGFRYTLSYYFSFYRGSVADEELY